MADTKRDGLPKSLNFTTWRHAIMAALAMLSALGAYHMRIAPAQHGIPIDFEDSVARGLLAHPLPTEPAIAIRKHYTGIEGVDTGLQFLVAAFISGPAMLEQRIWSQQIHFLAGFAPIIGIWTVESCRRRWRSYKGIRYTSPWALLYQTVGGAVIVPLCVLYHVFVSSTLSPSELASGQDLDRATRLALLPSIAIGYLLPTALLYMGQFSDLNTVMALTAFWQVTPIIVNVLLALLQPLFAVFVPGSTRDRHNAGMLYTFYAVLVAFAGTAHLYVLYVSLTSTSSLTSLHSVFVPNFADAKSSTSAGLHNIFQWDWILIAAAQLLWALSAVVDLKSAAATKVSLPLAIAIIAFCTALTGPGGALACTWWWRETRMIQLAGGEQKTE